MKKLTILWICLCGISCSHFEEEVTQEVSTSSQVVPIEEALMKMDLKASHLYGKTKSSSGCTVDVITSSDLQCRTKSDNENIALPDTLLYVVNFKNRSGFALLSASRKLKEDTFCLTEHYYKNFRMVTYGAFFSPSVE